MTNIGIFWDQCEVQEQDNVDVLVDEDGRLWTANYHIGNASSARFRIVPDVRPVTNNEALAIARNPNVSCNILCRPPSNRKSTVRELFGQFNQARSIKIGLQSNWHRDGRLLRMSPSSGLSLEGIEDFSSLIQIHLLPSAYHENAFREGTSLTGIEFCSSLKHLLCRSMEIKSLVPLTHLELDHVDIAFNPIESFSMVRTKKLTIDVSQIPAVEEAFESPCFRIESLHVLHEEMRHPHYEGNDEFGPLIIWNWAILLSDLQAKLDNFLGGHRSNMPIVTRQDLVNSINYGHVSYILDYNGMTEMTVANMKTAIIKCIRDALSTYDSCQKPICKDDSPSEISEIINKFSRSDFDPSKTDIREIMALWRFFGISDDHLRCW